LEEFKQAFETFERNQDGIPKLGSLVKKGTILVKEYEIEGVEETKDKKETLIRGRSRRKSQRKK
jgi:hypothetical protein